MMYLTVALPVVEGSPPSQYIHSGVADGNGFFLT